jgi:hypothetical protein
MQDVFAVTQRKAFRFVDGTVSWILWCCLCSDDGCTMRNLNSNINVTRYGKCQLRVDKCLISLKTTMLSVLAVSQFSRRQ